MSNPLERLAARLTADGHASGWLPEGYRLAFESAPLVQPPWVDRRNLSGHCPQCGEASCSIEGPHTWHGLRRWPRLGTYWPFVEYGRWPCCHRRRPLVAR